MNKTELIEAVSKKTKASKVETERFLAATLDAIQDSLAEGEAVTLTGFGTFSVREMREREGFHPRTREKIAIPASRVPTFKPGKYLRDAVN